MHHHTWLAFERTQEDSEMPSEDETWKHHGCLFTIDVYTG
jgi:hypothetical protein